MRLAEDDRGRVPFALLGVVLVVGSVAVATISLDADRVERDAALAGDRAEATVESALRETVRDAGARAAANPVVSPADTAFGDVLDDDRPFRSQLELLIALGLRDRLADTTQRVDGARATVDLSPITNATSAEAAMDRVDVSARRPGMIDVTVEAVPVVVRQGGVVVDRRNRTIEASVTSPALTLHDRTERFQGRLDGATLEGGSLSRGLTGGLYGLAWTRGYGQYAGLPIEDVIANRHAELVANLAVLDAQRATFGNSDPEAEAGLVAATTRVATNETVGLEAGGFLDAALPDPTADTPSFEAVTDSPSRVTTVGVNETADRALADVLEHRSTSASSRDQTGPAPETVGAGDSPEPWRYPLESIVRSAMSLEAAVSTATERGDRHLVESSEAPGTNWSRSDTGEAEVEVYDVGPGPGPSRSPGADGGDWDRVLDADREVVLQERVPVTYTHDGNGSERTDHERYRRVVDVAIALDHRPAGGDWIPTAPMRRPEGGTYASLVERAEAELIAAAADDGDIEEGLDALARDAATGEPTDTRTEIRPEELGRQETLVYHEVSSLADELRPISTEAELEALAGDASPASQLAGRIVAHEAAYREVPARYRDVEHRAMVAARSVYLDRVIDRLRVRSTLTTRLQGALADKVREISQLPAVGLDRLLSVGVDYARPEPRPMVTTPPVPAVSLIVDGDPGYLSLEQVNETRVAPPGGENASYYPLSARTRTIASLPTDEISDEIGEGIAGVLVRLLPDPEAKIDLELAARVLQGADLVPGPMAADAGLESERDELRVAVREGAQLVRTTAIQTVAERTALSNDEAAVLVDDATAGWESNASLAIAFADGSAADAIREALVRSGDVGTIEADRTATIVRDRIAETLSSGDVKVGIGVAEPVTSRVREVTAEEIAGATDRIVEGVADRLADRFERAPVVNLQGFPVVPIPGWWVATANVWRVGVHGTYAGFAVRARQGGPRGGAGISYRRDGRPVGVDVTGNGTPELLGHADRIRFVASTTVAVVVPPNGGGIGNTNASLEQTSPGWEGPTIAQQIAEEVGWVTTDDEAVVGGRIEEPVTDDEPPPDADGE